MQELESIEEQWRVETRELLSMVTKLQEENTRLLKAPSDPLTPTRAAAMLLPSPSLDTQILQKLQTQVDKQRVELKKKDKELQDKSDSLDQLITQSERQTNSGRETRKRLKSLQHQIGNLCEERADFLAQLQDQQREIFALKKRLGIAEKENEDLTKYPEDDMYRPRFTTAELKEVLAERNELKTRVNDLEEELLACKPLPPPKPEVIESPVDEEPAVQGKFYFT